MNKIDKIVFEGGAEGGLKKKIYHSLVGVSSINRYTAMGVAITEAASLHHHVVQSVVVFVLGITTSTAQQCVTEGEQVSEVHTDVGQCDQV